MTELRNIEDVDLHMNMHNLHALPVVAADCEPYLIGIAEEGDVFAQGLPFGDEDGSGNVDDNRSWLRAKSDDWWPVTALLPIVPTPPVSEEADHA